MKNSALIQWSTESGSGEATIWCALGHVKVLCPAALRTEVEDIASSAGEPREFTGLRADLEAIGFDLGAMYNPFTLFVHSQYGQSPKLDEAPPNSDEVPESEPAPEVPESEPEPEPAPRRGRPRKSAEG